MSVCGLSACVCVLMILTMRSPVVTADGSEGTAFIVGFMESFLWGRDLELIISTTSATPVKVEVTIPLLFPRWKRTVRVTNDDSEIVDIPIAVQGSGIELKGKGVYVNASGPVSVIGTTKTYYMADKYLAVPVDKLGQNYYVVTYTVLSEFMVLGTVDNTVVTITWPRKLRRLRINRMTIGGGRTLTIRMNRFETYHVLLPSFSSRTDLTGTRIVASHPVGVLSGNKYTFTDYAYTYDHLVEMLLPVNLWGTRYYITHTPNMRTGDIFIFMASQPQTTITFGDRKPEVLARAGDFCRIDVAHGKFQAAQSDRPIMAVMLSKSFPYNGGAHGDPSLTLLIPEKLYRHEYTWGTSVDSFRDKFVNSLTVIIDQNKISGLMLDGRGSLNWKGSENITGSTKVNLWMDVPHGTHHLQHQDPDVTFSAVLSGVARRQFASYLTPAGFGSALYHCEITGDPHLKMFNGQRVSLAIPCAYLVTRLRLTNSVYIKGVPFFSEIQVEVIGGNSQRTIRGRYFASDVCVKVSFEGGPRPRPFNTYCVGEGGRWRLDNSNETMQDRVVLSYDPVRRLATLRVTSSNLCVKFRAVDRNKGIRQRLKPGIFVQVGSEELIYDGSILFPNTLCSTVDDPIPLKEVYSNLAEKYVGIYAVLDAMEENLPSGDQDPTCRTLLDKWTACNSTYRQVVAKDCLALMCKPGVVRCFDHHPFNVTDAVSACMDHHCSGGTAGCSVLATYTSACPGVGRVVDTRACPPP